MCLLFLIVLLGESRPFPQTKFNFLSLPFLQGVNVGAQLDFVFGCSHND
jgi:hypothetical protein